MCKGLLYIIMQAEQFKIKILSLSPSNVSKTSSLEIPLTWDKLIWCPKQIQIKSIIKWHPLRIKYTSMAYHLSSSLDLYKSIMQYLCDHLWHLSLFPPLSPSKIFSNLHQGTQSGKASAAPSHGRPTFPFGHLPLSSCAWQEERPTMAWHW
jgi:hypothetical protein